MPIDTRWLDQQQSILVLTYKPELTWGEVDMLIGNRDSDVYRQQHPMCVIHVVEYLPAGAVLPHLKYILDVTPSRILGAVVVLKLNGAGRVLLNAMLKVLVRLRSSPGLLVTANSLDEAVVLCRQRLNTIPVF